MQFDEPPPRIGHRGNALSRAKHIALKTLVVLGGLVALVSAFVVSLAFLAVGLAVVLTVGGYLWWQTRDLRKQLRARMQEQSRPLSGGNVIEGELISQERTRR
jgi:hypothetical protein